MSQSPYVPFYTSDFLAGTSGLTAATKGVYITLLCLMYETEGPLPQSWDTLARRSGCSLPAFKRAVAALVDDRKLTVTDDGLWSEKCEKHIMQRHERRDSATSAAKKRWQKSEQKQRKADATASVPQCQPEPEPEYKKEDLRSSQKNRGSRLPDDWVLPMEWGRWAVDEGWSEVAVRDEAARFADYWRSLSGQKATKRDWLATWRNWMRNSKKPKGGLNGTGSFNGNGANHTGRGSAHDSLLAGFGAFARGDGDGSGFDPDGGETASHTGATGLDRGMRGDTSQPVLRLIGS